MRTMRFVSWGVDSQVAAQRSAAQADEHRTYDPVVAACAKLKRLKRTFSSDDLGGVCELNHARPFRRTPSPPPMSTFQNKEWVWGGPPLQQYCEPDKKCVRSRQPEISRKKSQPTKCRKTTGVANTSQKYLSSFTPAPAPGATVSCTGGLASVPANVHVCNPYCDHACEKARPTKWLVPLRL